MQSSVRWVFISGDAGECDRGICQEHYQWSHLVTWGPCWCWCRGELWWPPRVIRRQEEMAWLLGPGFLYQHRPHRRPAEVTYTFYNLHTFLYSTSTCMNINPRYFHRWESLFSRPNQHIYICELHIKGNWPTYFSEILFMVWFVGTFYLLLFLQQHLSSI